MPRYFFHFASKQELVIDGDGIELPDLLTAHQHAIRLVREAMPFLANDPRQGWVVEVTNTDSDPPLTVLFPHVQAGAAFRLRGFF